jgi:hypothetical protein
MEPLAEFNINASITKSSQVLTKRKKLMIKILKEI